MLTHRLVVPSDLVELLRAEHTIATLCLFKLGLKMSMTAERVADAILTTQLGQ